MNAVLLCGSPRKNGNTEFLLNQCSKKLENAGITAEVIRCSDVNVKPCKACGVCRTLSNMTCAIKDDDFDLVFSKICAADILICGSPVYFGSATPQLMAMLDRVGYMARSNNNLLSRKIGGPLVVARRAGHNFTFAQLLCWFMINDMVVPGSSYWNIAFGKDIGEVCSDHEGIATIERFTDNVIWLAEKLKK